MKETKKVENETIITKKFELITPEQAKIILEKYTDPNQRHINRAHIKRMAEDMRSGDWIWQNCETIKFHKDGNLIDGYHRLSACVEAGVPIKALVVRGLPDEAKLTIDVGMNRSPKDVLKFSGVENITTPHVTTIPPFVFGGRTGMKEAFRLSPIKQAEIYEKYKEPIDFAVEIAATEKQQVRAVIARAYHTVDHDVLRKFAEILKTGTTEEGITAEDSSAVMLRNFLAQSKRGVRSTLQSRKLYFKVEKALDAFVNRKKITRLKISEDETELFPLPNEIINPVQAIV